MIKKLDSLILRAFVGPFVATFLISLFVLVMQFFWLYIDDLVGKGLDLLTIATLIGYVAAQCVPMALPLALLLSSIMTFGNLGESFELVAIKSAGIPLTRFMRPLLVVTILFSGVAFLFSNNIIPKVNLKLNRLKYDIIVAKPAFDIKEGVFYDKLEGFVIKLGKKDADNQTIHDVLIFEKNGGLQDNLMIAKDGSMTVTPDQKYLQFSLLNGWHYEESGANYDNNSNTQYTRMGFKKYVKVFDLSSFKMGNTNEENFKSDPQMFSYRQLVPAIDSIRRIGYTFDKRSKVDLAGYLFPVKYQDSTWQKGKVLPKSAKNPSQLYSDSVMGLAINNAMGQASGAMSTSSVILNDYNAVQDTLRHHQIELYRKFTLSAACLILFIIGAPLGSIIRKGGLGSPMVFAVIFFSLYYVFSTIGEKMAKQGVVPPIVGMWLSAAILLPVGIFLTVKAMKDSELFNKESWFRMTKSIQQRWKKMRKAAPVSAE